jgi:hypothetical protein
VIAIEKASNLEKTPSVLDERSRAFILDCQRAIWRRYHRWDRWDEIVSLLSNEQDWVVAIREAAGDLNRGCNKVGGSKVRSAS